MNFIIRTKSVGAEYKSLLGKILTPVRIDNDKVICNVMNGISSVKGTVGIPKSLSQDDGWYDVTDLMYESNDAVAPSLSSIVFENDVALAMRNFISNYDDFILTEEESIGKIVFIGTKNENKYNIHNVGYYVIDFDENGYGIAFYGYGDVKSEADRYETDAADKENILKIIKVRSDNIKLFDAKKLVDFCNKTVFNDLASANEYLETAKEAIKLDVETEVSKVKNSNINTMHII